MPSTTTKMATAKSLEEMLSSEVDERTINAFIQSLDTQLSSNVHLPPQDVGTGGNSYAAKQSNVLNEALKHASLERPIVTTNNSQGFCVNNVASAALNDNLVVTLASALPASGYINQVANTHTQSTVLKNVTLDGNLDTKIHSQGNIAQLNTAHISTSNRTVIQRNSVVNHTSVANSSSNITAQLGSTMLIRAGSMKPTSQGSNSAIHPQVMVSNVSNPVLVQPPVILSTDSQCSLNGSINQVSETREQKAQINSVPILIPNAKQEGAIPLCNQNISASGKVIAGIKTEPGQHLPISVSSSVPLTSTVHSQQQTKPINVVTQVVSSGNILPGVHILNMCVSNSGTTQKTIAPRMAFSNPVRITTSPQVIAARPRVAVPNAITLPQGLIRNTLLVRTETGQFQMLNVAPGLTAAGGIPTTYRLEAVQPRPQTSVATSVLQPNQQNLNVVASMPPAANVGSLNSHIKKTIASSVSHPLTIQTTLANSQSTSSSSQQMSPNTAKKKCKNFLSTLIRLASNQPNDVADNVKSLIQRIIDGIITPEEFSNQLQKELSSSPQPYLIPFLKKNLPYLRHSLMTGELSIEGIRPPPPGSVLLPPPSQVIQVKSVPQQSQIRVVSPSVLQGALASSSLGQQLVVPRLPGVAGVTGIKTIGTTKSVSEVFPQPTKSVLSKASSSSSKDRERDKKNFASLREDDDINDVAAMGGVNLLEESQRILATNADIVGTQIRSCKDETFFPSGLLHRRILRIANKFGIDDVSNEVVALISHAAQERLKSLVEKLGVVVANYVEDPKLDPRYEVVSDVKEQIECLKEADRLHNKICNSEEDKVFSDPSKVRLKFNNSEELNLQYKGKETSDLEAKHNQTNLTALLAIGPRKRLRTDIEVNRVNKRLKRATLRDIIFVMEQDKEMCHSSLLYKAYTK